MLGTGYVILLGISSIIVQYVTKGNRFKYHGSGIYFIGTGNAQSNPFYGIDELSIFYFRYSSSKEGSIL